MDEIAISVAKKNQKLIAKQHGNITVKTFYDGYWKTRTMQDVLFVEMQFNVYPKFSETRFQDNF